LLVAGCATAPRGKAPAPALAPPPPARPAAVAPAAKPGPPVRAWPADQFAVRIESLPAGALIVVGEQVLGRAPVTAIVPLTPQGFFAANVTVRARFLATDPQHESVSVQQEFTPLDKVPAALVLTPEGAQRVAR